MIQNIMKISIGIAWLLIVVTSSNPIKFIKETHKTDAEALCLDGSNSFLYFPESTAHNNDGLLIYFLSLEENIFCGNSTLSSSLDNCVQIRDSIASSWSNNLTINDGILTDPMYQSWAKVIIPHCDGCLFQGYNKNSTKYKNKDLYFRGNKVVQSNLDYLNKKFSINLIKKFILAGSGFGAIGVTQWATHFYDQILLKSTGSHDMVLILDSFISSYPSIRTKQKEYDNYLVNLKKLANIDGLNPQSLCTLRNEGQQWKCLLLQNSYIYLDFKILIVESQYDPYVINKVLEINCVNGRSLSTCTATELKYIESYRSMHFIDLFELLAVKDNCAWTIACVGNNLLKRNTYSNDNFVIGNYYQIKQAVNSFIANQRVAKFDYTPWPVNANCSK